MEASRELNALLNLNRALTRPAVKARVSLRELVTRGAERVGVSVNGALPDSLTVSVGVAPVTHAFALSVDVAAGSGRGRALTVETAASDGVVENRAGHLVGAADQRQRCTRDRELRGRARRAGGCGAARPASES